MKKIIPLLFIVIFTSCISAVLNQALEKVGVFDDKAELKMISTNDKNLIFIGMHHIGRKEFYDDMARKVDSLQRQGYVVLYELIKKSNGIDSVSNDIYKKKFRKIMGIANTKYYDTINNLIAGRFKYKGNYKLTNQPSYNNLKVDMENAKNIDVELVDLIKAFELKHGEIDLDDCDQETKSDSPVYDCNRIDNDRAELFKNEFVFTYRNKNIANEIHNSTEKNILVIYGKNHFDGLRAELDALDKNWK